MTETKKRLGRGLNSLLSSTRLEDVDDTITAEIDPQPQLKPGKEETAEKSSYMDATGRVLDLPINVIQRNPHQPRQHWDDEKLSELAESIKQNGLVQPIMVRPYKGFYQLIAGERRLRASEMAGKTMISAIIKDATEEQMLEWALVENIHRADLSVMERAAAYQNYIQSFSLSQQEAAERLGEDRATIANYMRLLSLPEEIRQFVDEGQLSMGHARALLGIKDVVGQSQMARQSIRFNFSVRELERRIQQMRSSSEVTFQKEQKSANILELERDMTRTLGTKVSIKTTGKKQDRGRIVIEYYSLDDFDRIRERLF